MLRRRKAHGSRTLPKPYGTHGILSHSLPTPVAPAQQIHGFSMLVGFSITKYTVSIFIVLFVKKPARTSCCMLIGFVFIVVSKTEKRSPEFTHIIECICFIDPEKRRLLRSGSGLTFKNTRLQKTFSQTKGSAIFSISLHYHTNNITNEGICNL